MRLERTTKILLLVMILTVPSSTYSYIICKPYSYQELSRICGGCGLCLFDTPIDHFRCTFDKQDYFYEETKCKVINKCNSNENKGKCKAFKCLPMFGSFKCECDKHTFGRLCEFSKPQGIPDDDYAVVADVVMAPSVTVGYVFTLSIFFYNLGRNVIVKVEFHNEVLTYNSKVCKAVVVADYCKKWLVNYPQLCKNNPNLQGKILCVMTINNIFSTKHNKGVERIDYVLESTENLLTIAHKTIFTVTVFNDLKTGSKSPVFNNSYYVFHMMQGPLTVGCDPRMSWRNVAHSMKEKYILNYAMRDEIIIHSSYIPSPNKDICVGTSKNMYYWKVWKLNDNFNMVYQKPDMKAFEDTKLSFKPFSLDKGIYKISLNVSNWTGQNISYDAIFGYFRIIELGLEAVISGGEERVIYYNTKTLKLDGVLSHDPNLRPSQQSGSLKFYWRCNRTDLGLCAETRSDYNKIYPGPFLANEYYTFYLTVKSVTNESKEDTTSQIIFMSPTNQLSVELICRKNCGWGAFRSNPGVVIYFEAVVNISLMSSNNFNWTYRTGTVGNYLPVDNIRQNNTPSNILIVLRNTLSAGENYTFRAKVLYEITGEATFLVKMANNLSNVPCQLSPEFKNATILRGVTMLKVECDSVKFNKFASIYDFYDMYPDENVTGRLIASGRSVVEFDLVLVRGNLVVEVIDEYGMTTHSEVNVKLKDIDSTRDLIYDLLNSLREMSSGTFTDANDKTNTMSLIYDLMTSEQYNFSTLAETAEYMLKICADIEIDNIPTLKIVLNFLNTLAGEDLKTNLSMHSVNYISTAVTKLSDKLLFEIKRNVKLTDISELTITEIQKLCHQLLKICDSIYVSSVLDLTKKVENKEDTQDYYASYRASSSFLMQSVRNIMSCLSLITLPYEWPTILKEDHIDLWLKEDTLEAFSETGYEPVPSVELSEDLAMAAGKLSKFVVIHVARFDGNPYSYNRMFKIYTNAVDLQILFKFKDNELRVIDSLNPVVINLQHMKTEKTVIKGSVQQPDSNKSLSLADMQVAVHQLRVPQMGRLKMKFLDLEDGQIIRVKVLFNKRPDYKFMIDEDVVNITKSSPSHKVTLKAPQSHDIYDLYYIGILPGSNYPINQSINYSFEISTFHCVNWKFHEWSTSDCKIKGANESYELKCECDVFSTFAGYSQIPLNKLDPFKDLKLVLTETNNLVVQLLLILLLLAFLLLLILALWKDYSNVKGKVIYLEDNFPGDRFSYLVAVFTGSKFFGGTTSNVGIMIEGDKSCSRPHMLRSSWCRTLKKGEDDWFMLSTMSHLGNLEMIHLWMDYSGRRPEWYCYKIIIIDMLSHKQYLFFVDAWLSLRGKHFIERFVKVTRNENDKRLYMVVDNLIFGLRDTHIWLGVCFGHPRSIVSRAQRLTTAFNELLIIMLVSCLFLTVLEQRSEDYPHYIFSPRVLLITYVSIIISSISVNILMSIFRKTFLFKTHLDKENKQVDELDAVINPKHKSTNFVFRCLEDSLKVFTNRKKFKPVILKFDNRGIHRKQTKLSLCCLKIGWIISLIMILICFVIIYFYSISMRKVKTLIWLTCIVLSLFLVLFVVAPIRILCLAALSGWFYYNINQVVSYHIRMHLLDRYKRGLVNKEHHLVSKLISMRRHSCYLPLTYKKIMKKHHRQRKFDAMLLLLDMFIIGVLVVLLFIQNETLWTTKYYWHNEELRSLMRQGYREEGVQLYSLTNLSQYSLFLEKRVFPVVYQTRWYNKLPIIDENATDDERFVFGGTSKLFGLPRLRQIRLRPDTCEKPIYENLSQYCNVKLTKDTEDSNLYAEGWVETGPRENFPKLSPWNHMNDSETYDTTLFGYSNIAYKGDGYVAELEMTEEKAEDIVLTLHREKWLDRRTCVVIFELTLYNAFSGTFSWVISVTENLHVGMLMNRVYVFTVSDSYKYPIVDIMFFVGLFLFMVRVFFVVNRNGIDDLADDFWNILEIIMICFSITCAALFILNINSKFNYLKINEIGDTREKYFQYFHLLKYLNVFRIIFSILAIMLVCRFIKSWRFGKTFHRLFQTLFCSWGVIAVLFLTVFIVSYLYWAFLSFMINDFMSSKHNFPVMSRIDYKQITKSCNIISCKASPFVLCFISLIVQLLIVVVFLSSFRIVKRRNIEIPPLNFCTVFNEKFEKYLYKVKHHVKKRLLKLTN